MSAPVPLCYTYVHQDGAWWGAAWPRWDGLFWWSINDLISRGATGAKAAIAVRMSDESLIIVRPKKVRS